MYTEFGNCSSVITIFSSKIFQCLVFLYGHLTVISLKYQILYKYQHHDAEYLHKQLIRLAMVVTLLVKDIF